MWQLPPLRWQHAQWCLPLRAWESSQLALALIDGGDERLGRLAALLATSPEFVLWSICRGPVWLDRPPSTPRELAEWLWEYLTSDEPFDLVPLEANSVPSPEGAAVAGEDPRVPSGAHWILQLRQPAWPRLSALWESTVADACPPFDEVPWLPLWLRSHLPQVPAVSTPPTLAAEEEDGECVEEDEEDLSECESTDSSCEETSAASDSLERELAAMLPRMLTRARRLARVERDFASQLEREKLAAMRELAYGASHEINNPLANIATRAQALLREDPDPDRKQKLATIAAQAFRAYEMIADMMLFAKPPAPQFRRMQVDSAIEKVLSEVRGDAESQGTTLRSVPSGTVLEVDADPTQVETAVKALIRNALEAVASGGTVEVSCELRARGPGTTPEVAIAVRDSGPGISADVRRHLFDPFFSGREAGRGLGFGLSKCWRIAELHGGRVDVASEPGFGATFTLYLPTIRTEADLSSRERP